MSQRLTPYLLSAPAAALLAGLLVSPLVLLVRVSLYEPAHGRGFFTPDTWTTSNFTAVTDAHGLRLLGFTVLFGVGVAALTILLGYPLALFVRSLPPRARVAAVGLILLAKLANVLAILFGLLHLLGATGPVNQLLMAGGLTGEPATLVRNLFGAVVGEVYLILPYTVLVLFIQLTGMDPVLPAAARGLGASAGQVFVRVTLPLSAPGLVLAGQLGLMWGLGAFLGPLVLGGPAEITLSVEVHRQAFEYGRWTRAAALALVLLLAVGGCLAVYGLLTGRFRKTT
jgi:ABC-type spermidine/putrescine transport system permease subunit I